ncbi:hypothetical protein A2V71_00330 [Candidatus Berkelbacteria bacterium RBG_13_40_8]|uniref:Uncharacterized protein n=1 Tax=Candidatus Berkelbacteria bacterium RBG_13_40_8 TaxID=1797467 RepID=A0A1F5DPJ5_9BACT|nr:MAG: hypothetical protein A2V71_00330 [Candidatus Berkelbacteria bacterium RBG_13_40_8]
MEMSRLAKELLTLKEGEKRTVYTSEDGTQVTVKHTGKISEKDFAVGLTIPNEPDFNPTHIRLLVDLYIKRESNPGGFEKLFKAFEEMFSGEDPVEIKDEVKDIDFPMHLDSSETNLYYTQLLMIEQDLNYGPNSAKPSKCDPPRDYLMRFVRWIASGEATIDRVIFGAVRRFPAPEKFANKKSTK